ncbi:hypothetical protein ASPCAL13626 [Aspergillus calidoustus]|uniref:Uncharacterized protein n=1 Tax=Aspergillus calidoustus TaxID=454130 RepID=A0A0U5GF53_ASPCI|nr:hypothetical protein ASPCAL13626 [Aspergillus calidoustus]
MTILACNRVDRNAQDNGGRTPLVWAVDGGLLQEVQPLLETPDIDLKPDNYGNTIFHIAAQNGHLEILNMIAHQTDLNSNSKNSRGQTPIWLNAANDQESVVTCLVDKAGVDSDCRSNSGLSPLMLAVQKGHTRTVRALVLDPLYDHRVDSEGNSALSLASSDGDLQVVKFIVSHRPMILDSKNMRGELHPHFAFS